MSHGGDYLRECRIIGYTNLSRLGTVKHLTINKSLPFYPSRDQSDNYVYVSV